MSCIFRVNSGFGDPVKKTKLRELDRNPYAGYYGFVRDKGETFHGGFDYEAIEGTSVLSSFPTKELSIEVYIGRPAFDCPLRKEFSNNIFSYEICKKCPLDKKVKRGCYGVRLFLIDHQSKIKTMYAHLYSINQSVLSVLKFNKGSNFYSGRTKIYKGQEVALSGNTGIAYQMVEDNKSNQTEQQHLHFECYINDTKVNPNNGVHTKFKLKRVSVGYCGQNDNEVILDYLVNTSKDQWKHFWKRRDLEIAFCNMDRYKVIGEIED